VHVGVMIEITEVALRIRLKREVPTS